MTTASQQVIEPDPDALVRAVRASRGVDDLDGGAAGSAATYLPGRRIPGLRIEPARVTVQIRATGDVPFVDVAAGIRAALAPLVAGRTVDVFVSDIADGPSPAALTARPVL